MLPGVCAASENCSAPQSTQELEANLRKVSQSRRREGPYWLKALTYIITFSHLRICYAKHLITIHRQSKGHNGWAGCFSIV